MSHSVRIAVCTLTIVVLASATDSGFSLVDSRWDAGTIDMEFQLGPAPGGLIDGSADWDECAIKALNAWNAELGPTGRSFNAITGSTRTPAEPDSVNSVFFSDDIYGTAFGDKTLAVTTNWFISRDGVDRRTESDVIFNNAQPFNCYPDELRALGPTPESAAFDLIRVALHEFGHTLGLLHPDEAGQALLAIMNSIISDLDVLQLDDIQGALTLYGVSVTGIPFPPRNEALDFFLSLEGTYRDTLGRAQTNQGFVDAEGTAVWFPEWLRYVLNGCSSSEASARVLLQIGGLGIQPVCGVISEGVIDFPPRDQSLDFLNTLDAYYLDTLARTVILSFIDLEGKAVWMQEYLRYRVNGCNDADATSRVVQQINGGGIAPVCAMG
jgi:hypothetical protein